jgi:hypothetical protein
MFQKTLLDEQASLKIGSQKVVRNFTQLILRTQTDPGAKFQLIVNTQYFILKDLPGSADMRFVAQTDYQTGLTWLKSYDSDRYLRLDTKTGLVTLSTEVGAEAIEVESRDRMVGFYGYHTNRWLKIMFDGAAYAEKQGQLFQPTWTDEKFIVVTLDEDHHIGLYCPAVNRWLGIIWDFTVNQWLVKGVKQGAVFQPDWDDEKFLLIPANEGAMCMEKCGQYAGCDCRHQKGSIRPDRCTGETEVQGPRGFDRPDNGLEPLMDTTNHSCDDTPYECQNHIPPADCNQYRLCPADLCLINRVECPPLDQCTEEGTCVKSEGLCFYSDKPDGTPCNDGLDYTVRDQCVQGVCAGVVDYCERYEVKCPVFSQCMEGGVCQPATGRCTYDNRPDEEPCDDGRDFTVEDRCQNGFCQGVAQDLCVEQGINCSKQVTNECLDPGVCDPKTGECSLPVPVSNRSCDDLDPTSVDDECIDGLCVGYASQDWPSQKFQTLGDGRCVDRKGRTMPSYSGDVVDESECEELCRADRQCVAFAYSPPVCSLYGSVRTQPPEDDGRSYSFQGGTVPAATQIEASMSVYGQRDTVCRKKDQYGDTVLTDNEGKMEASKIFTPAWLLTFFFSALGLFMIRPIWRCLRVCFCGVPPQMQEKFVFVQSPSNPSAIADAYVYDPAYEQDQLRAIGSDPAEPPIAPLPTDFTDNPDAPVSPPHALMPPDPDSPQPASQALAPLTLPPTGSSAPDLPLDIGDDASSVASKKKGWSRPGMKKSASRMSKSATEQPQSSQFSLPHTVE